MRFRFDPCGERAGGIRLIEEIPDYRICHLEGRNGAGKSLALRLLELISGEQPYAANPGAWASLRQNLGDTTVTINGLTEQKTLRVSLKPERWSVKPDRVDEWLGDAFLNESPIKIASLSTLLRVVRIAGDETFEKTIQRRLAAESVAIERAHNRFAQNLAGLERLLDELRTATATIDPERRDQKRLENVTGKLEDTEGRLRASQEDISTLEQALLARKRLADLAVQLPDIQGRLAELELDSKDLDERLRLAQDRQATLLAGLAGGSEIKDQVRAVRRTRDQRLKRVQNSANQIQRAAAQLKTALNLDAVAAAITETKAARSQVQSDLASAGHNASVRDMTSHVGRYLDEHRELDREVVAVLNSDAPVLRLTAGELREGLQRRRIELTEVEDDPLLRDLKQSNAELSRRLLALGELREKIVAHESARDRLRSSEADLAALVDRAEVTDALRAEYEKVAAEVSATDEQLRQRLAEKISLQVHSDQLTAGKSTEELSEQLTLALERLGIHDPEALDLRYQAAKTSNEEYRDQLRQLRAEQIELQRSVAQQEEEVRLVSARLAAVEWLPMTMRKEFARGTSHSGDTLVSLNKAVEAVRSSLYQVRSRFDQLLAAARRLVVEVGRRDRIPSDGVLLEEFAEAMGAKILAEFNQEEIRSALFDGGQLRSIDLRRLEAHWETDSGELRIRPFEAFSSGEQVFAYTRARIEAVSALSGEHKVIALDEFGAFLERDRLERLASYLRDEVGGSIADQVIIVVPLAANYKKQAEVTSGELGKRFAHRAAEIERRSYLFTALKPSMGAEQFA